MADLPRLALSVRQPWAWAIIHGGKDIENRNQTAINRGEMTPGRIAIHASKGLTRPEYDITNEAIRGICGDCPRPDELVRGAIIGSVTVVRIVKESESPWFVGPRGLVLAAPEPCEPIPVLGRLGYFPWEKAGEVEKPLPWMRAWPGIGRGGAAADAADLPLFGDDA